SSTTTVITSYVLSLLIPPSRRSTLFPYTTLFRSKDFLKVRCRLALLPFLISCLIWFDLVASLPLIKERILVIISGRLATKSNQKIGRAVQQECRDRSRMPSSA